MILLVGQIARGDVEREAFQEVDYRRMFGQHGEVGGGDRQRRAHPGARRPRLRDRDLRPTRPRRRLACPRTCSPRRPRWPTRGPTSAPRPGPAQADLERAARLHRRGRAPARRSSAASPGRPRPDAAARRLVRAASASPSRPRGAARTTSTTARPPTPATSGWRRSRASPRGFAIAMPSLLVGTRLGDIETAGYTALSAPRPGAGRSSTCTRRRRRSAGSSSRRCRSSPRAPRFAEALAGRRRSTGAARSRGSPRPTPTRSANRVPRAARRRGRSGRDRPATSATSLPDDAILTNGAGNFSVWAHRFFEFRRYRTQLAPQSRLDGLRRTGGDRREAPPSRARGRLHRRRRRLPDDRPGARDRGAAGARRSSSWSSTTECTGRSGCTRSGRTRAASAARSSATPTSSRSPAPTAATASASSGRPTSRPPSSARSRAGVPAVVHVLVDPETLTPRQTLTEIRDAALAHTTRTRRRDRRAERRHHLARRAAPAHGRTGPSPAGRCSSRT